LKAGCLMRPIVSEIYLSGLLQMGWVPYVVLGLANQIMFPGHILGSIGKSRIYTIGEMRRQR
jgi:hypothetical protein